MNIDKLNDNERFLPEYIGRMLQSRTIAAVIIIFLAFIAASPLLSPGWFNSHEGNTIIERVVAISYEVRHGDFYPRWLSLANHGKGTPFLNFYAPGFYLVSAYLNAAGLPILLSVKLLSVIIFFLGAWGMYLWMRGRTGGAGALLASVLYLFVPYHFVDIYVRGAMAEFTALAFFPYLFHGIDMTLDREDRYKGCIVTAMATAAILLTHQLSGIMIAPFAALYLLWQMVQTRPDRLSLMAAIAGPCIGIGLAGFYWLPVVGERQYLKDFTLKVTTGYFSYKNHFVYPSQWFSSFWGFGASFPGTADDGMSFQIGLVLLIFMAFAIFFLVQGGGGNLNRFAVVLAICGLAGVILTSEISLPVYNVIPWYSYIQFPWRFLGPATFFLSAFAALSASTRVLASRPMVTAALLLIAVLMNITVSTGHRAVVQRLYGDYDRTASMLITERAIGRLSDVNDYLPRWVGFEELWQMPFPAAPLAPTARIDGLKVEGSHMDFNATSEQGEAVITIPWFYFPGWQVAIDGRKQPAIPAPNGFIMFTLPQGNHRIEVGFGTTSLRIAGWLISMSTLLGVAGFCFYLAKRRRMLDKELQSSEGGTIFDN